MVDLGDLAVLDGRRGFFRRGLKAADDAHGEIVLAVDAHNANGLVADSLRGHFADQRLNFGVAYVCGGAAR